MHAIRHTTYWDKLRVGTEHACTTQAHSQENIYRQQNIHLWPGVEIINHACYLLSAIYWSRESSRIEVCHWSRWFITDTEGDVSRRWPDERIYLPEKAKSDSAYEMNLQFGTGWYFEVKELLFCKVCVKLWYYTYTPRISEFVLVLGVKRSLALSRYCSENQRNNQHLWNLRLLWCITRSQHVLGNR